MRIDLEVLSSFDLIITTSASDSECVSVDLFERHTRTHCAAAAGQQGEEQIAAMAGNVAELKAEALGHVDEMSDKEYRRVCKYCRNYQE